MLSCNATEWMSATTEWAASYFGDDQFWLFVELARVLDRLDDWEWVNRTSASIVADRMGFHGGSVTSRNDIAKEPAPL